MDRIIKRIENILLGIFIFLLPTNLSLHLFKDSASVLGVTVDYLIPKIYLSDIWIGLLLFFWLVKKFLLTRKNPNQSFKKSSANSTFWPILILLLLSLFVSSAQSLYPISAYWFLAKVVQIIILIFYLRENFQISSMILPLKLALIFQSIVGIVQWVQKSSLIGYWFLGETSLKNHSLIAKTGITGEIRPLPYGTTPHPNVLAGFLAIGTLLLILAYKVYFSEKKHVLKRFSLHWWKFGSLFLATFIPVFITIVLTQSVSGVVALVLGIVLFWFKSIHWRNVLAIVAILVSIGLASAPYVEPTSVSRRIDLAEISLNMVKSEPWIGVGPNNFTARISQFGKVVGRIRFIQPVHNIYLLWLSETGLISTTLLLMLLYLKKDQILSLIKNATSLEKKPTKKTKSKLETFSRWHTSIPLLAILVIGLADHYPLTLQTGQLLMALCIGVLGVEISKVESSKK